MYCYKITVHVSLKPHLFLKKYLRPSISAIQCDLLQRMQSIRLAQQITNYGSFYAKNFKLQESIRCNESAELKELKTVYRNLMKDWHPDKFQDKPEEKEQAEEKSKKIIEAYHFLVSIAPETREQTLGAYTETTTNSGIIDFEYKSEFFPSVFQTALFMNIMAFPKPFM
jgi:hypothetical protein